MISPSQLPPEALARSEANMKLAKEIAADLHDHSTGSAQCILELAICTLLLKQFDNSPSRAMAYLTESHSILPLLMMAAQLELETPSK